MYDKYQEILNNQELRKNKSRKKKKNIFLLIINRTKDTANILGISISKKIIYHKKSGRQAIVWWRKIKEIKKIYKANKKRSIKKILSLIE